MAWPIFSTVPRKILGIDIGTSTIRVVELSRAKDLPKLENYGEIESKHLYGKPFRTFDKRSLSLSKNEVALAIKAILQEAKIDPKVANFSLPDFSSFFTTFTLPPMSGEELKEAVKFEARQHVPLPISDMALDWMTIGEVKEGEQVGNVKILLVAIPQRVVEQYQEIAALSGLEPKNLEAEVFSLNRALIYQEDENVAALIDIGAQSTTCSIIDGNILKLSHSFDIAGNNLIKGLVEELDLDAETAEHLQNKYGVTEKGRIVRKILIKKLDDIIIEIDKMFQHFHNIEGKVVKKIVLAGGLATMPGLPDYLAEKTRKQVEIGNPFEGVSYPQILEGKLRESGPAFSIAVGVAKGALAV